MVVRKVSFDGISARLKELGTFSSRVSAVGNLKVVLDYMYYELLDGINRNILSKLGDLFEIEYNNKGIIIKTIHFHGARHFQFFQISKEDFKKLKIALNQLSEDYLLTVILFSFDEMKCVVSLKP